MKRLIFILIVNLLSFNSYCQDTLEYNQGNIFEMKSDKIRLTGYEIIDTLYNKLTQFQIDTVEVVVLEYHRKSSSLIMSQSRASAVTNHLRSKNDGIIYISAGKEIYLNDSEFKERVHDHSKFSYKIYFIYW